MVRKLMILALGLAVVASFGDAAFAQRGGQRGGPRGFGGGGSTAMLLGSEEVREALELSDDQVERIEEMQAEMREEMQDLFGGMRDMDPEERREAFGEIREKMTKLNEDMEKDLDDVLLAHQREKLVAMQAKTASRFGGVSGLLGNESLMKKLGLSSREVEKLREKARELQEEQNEEIEKLREKYNDKLIAMLPDDAQETVREWMKTEVPEMNFRRGRGGNDRGNDRGGRGNAPRTRPQDF